MQLVPISTFKVQSVLPQLEYKVNKTKQNKQKQQQQQQLGCSAHPSKNVTYKFINCLKENSCPQLVIHNFKQPGSTGGLKTVV